jgi:hypothetical protein
VAVLARQRTWFCILVAVVAAAFADPLVEFASNAGAFGRCDCTDHSNLDVLPALAAGILLGIALLSLRIRNVLAGQPVVAPAVRRIVPAVFAIQIAVLYAMETAEQFVVDGHVLGGSIWLGGPLPISLAIHAAFGIVATYAIGRALRAFTQTAVQIVVLLRLSKAIAARAPRRMIERFPYPASFRRTTPLLCRIGERAPPLFTA